MIETKEQEFYAGDAAWQELFDVCSVAGCSGPTADSLRREVVSAMRTQLSRYGIDADEMAEWVHSSGLSRFFD